MKYILLLISLLFLNNCFFAQEDIDEEQLQELREMSLEELLKSEIYITTQTPLSMREAPGIVTLITRDEIINTGSRDLIDVLTLLVPGFNFEQSQYGPIGLGVRGIWAFEGKLLLLIDGVECNDEAFSGILFGNHYLVENIERIEIIRGPGSVIYGGHAGLGVINIITRGYKQFDGLYAAINHSQMYKHFSHRNLSFGIAHTYKNFNLSLTGYAGDGTISDRNFVPYFDNDTYKPQIRLTPLSFNLNLNYNGLDFRSIYDRYNTIHEIPINFDSYINQLKYDLNLGNNLTISALLSNKIQYPWQIKTKGFIFLNGAFVDSFYSNSKKLVKNRAAISTLWDVSSEIHIASGIEFQNIDASVDEVFPGYYELFTGTERAERETSNFIAYSQILFQTNVFNLTLGGRYDNSKDFGTSFVPRIALTKIFDPFHVKIMVSRSYRIPGGVYFDLNLEPEKAINYEVEFGLQFTKNHFLLINLYDVMFKDVISLKQDSTFLPIYKNAEKIGTRGLEADYKIVKNNFNLGINASYYTVTENSAEIFKVKNKDDVLIAYPKLKVNLYTGIKLNEKISFNPSLSYFGERYGYIAGNVRLIPEGLQFEHILKKFDQDFIFNVNVTTRDLFLKGMQLDLGIRNLFNSNFEYIQSYQGFEAPLPANSSSIVLRMYYEFSF